MNPEINWDEFVPKPEIPPVSNTVVSGSLGQSSKQNHRLALSPQPPNRNQAASTIVHKSKPPLAQYEVAIKIPVMSLMQPDILSEQRPSRHMQHNTNNSTIDVARTMTPGRIRPSDAGYNSEGGTETLKKIARENKERLLRQ